MFLKGEKERIIIEGEERNKEAVTQALQKEYDLPKDLIEGLVWDFISSKKGYEELKMDIETQLKIGGK